MTSISLPPQSSSAFSHYFDSADRPSPGHSRRNLSMSTPLPNPHFIFPARDPEAESHQGSENGSSDKRPTLPAFCFNPGSTTSSQAPSVPVGRVGGHRRQYSEFVGSERLVTVPNMGTTNDEASSMSNTNLPTPGPGFSASNRRRHAHRRSAAISSVDLTAIQNALDVKPNAESAPCTPADTKCQSRAEDETHQQVSYAATSRVRHTPPPSPQILVEGHALSPENYADQPQPAPRSPEVFPKGFETVLQVSPEPQGGSEDDGVSFSNGGIEFDSQKPKPRPRTADASLMLDQSGLDFTNDLMQRPVSAAGHTRAHKSLSSGILDVASRKDSYPNDGGLYPDQFRRSSDEESDVSLDDHDFSGSLSSASKKKSKAKKRQKKVRSWAGALLTRNKGKKHQSERGPSEAGSKSIPPPVLTRTNSDLGSGLEVDFDDDNIVVIRTPTNPTAPDRRQAPSETESWSSLEDSWKPRSFYEQTASSDALSPVIDLDAALGPFNTPDMRSGRVPESGFSAATKRMYSGGRRGEFVGPEMRYHRRAESAPEMPPFDRSLLGKNRFTTSSTLENPDVFYEEEEDAFLAATSESGKTSEENLQTQSPSTGLNDMDNQSEESKDSSKTLTRHSVVEKPQAEHSGLGIQQTEVNEEALSSLASSTREDPQRIQSQNSSEQMQNAPNPFTGRPKTPLESLKHEDWRNRIPVPPSPDISPRFLPADHRPVTSPTELISSIPLFSLHGGCSLPNSSFPSPDFTVSSEAPRSITTSSTTDRNFSNFSNPSYNPSMEFPHASVEDVPSLTSSASTMTNTLNRVSATFFVRPRLSTDRSASFSAAVNRRSSQPGGSKRSSLASLSKLVVGPHAERSKLSYEEKPPGDETEKAKRKGRRISRLMHFWRTKDKEKPNEHTTEQ